ncbi:MAG: hypothetical protein AAGG56_07070 [Pseudomonadota bacterium]
MPTFTFTEHRHDSRIWFKNGQEIETHTLELTGTDPETGVENRAILIFDCANELYSSCWSGAVGYLTKRSEGGMSLVGWLPYSEFYDFLEIIAQGEPLTVHFILRDPKARVGYVRHVGIGNLASILSAAITSPAFGEPRGTSNVVRFPV